MTGPTARVVAFGCSLLASAVFSIPLIAAFRHPDVSLTFRVLILLLAAASAVRPALGIALLTVLLPMVTPLQRLVLGMPAPEGLNDGLMLAFLAGASWRLAWPRSGPPSRLAGPAAVLAAAVIGSALVEFQALQAVVPRQPLARDLWLHVITIYWVEPGQFPLAHDAVRWVAALWLAMYVERALVRDDGWRPLVFRTWMVGGAAGGVFAGARLAEVLVRSELSAPELFTWVFQQARFSVLHPDLNAAGSYFALFLVPCVIVALRRRVVWMLAAAMPLLLVGFLLARSRAAMGSVLAVITLWGSAHLMGQMRRRTAVLVAVAGVCLAGAMLILTSRSNVNLDMAVEVRIQMTEVAVRTIARAPVFGVGLGDYIRMSRLWISDDMALLKSFAPLGENAHDNFLQIAAELGIPAGLVFCYLGFSIVLLGWPSSGRRAPPELEGVTLGLLAFLCSAIFGHPLLIPQVAVPFFLAVGLAAGHAPPMQGDARTRRSIAAGGVAFYVVSLVWRLA